MRLSRPCSLAAASLLGATLSLSCGDATSSASVPGGIILFTNDFEGRAEIYGIRPDGTSQWQITRNNVLDVSADWSPDGTEIVVTSYRDTTPGHEAAHPDLFVIRPDGRIARRLTRSDAGYSSPRWSPDGQRIAFDATDPATGHRRIFVMNRDGSNPQPLSPANRDSYTPDWSPDGTRILYVGPGQPDGWWAIHVMRATDGVGAQQLAGAECAMDIFHARFSPDGSRIAYSCYGGSEVGNAIYVMNADGTGVVRLSPPTSPGSPTADSGTIWSPDGRTIAFTRGLPGPYDVFTIDAAGGEARRLTTDGKSLVDAWGAAR